MKTTVVVGIAGSGKTAHAMGIVEDRVKAGMSPWHIGFSSFSRAACAEAAERAAEVVGIDAGRLQTTGFFRTLHSVVLRCLGIDARVILDHDSASGQKFMTEVFGTIRGGEAGTLGAKIDEALNWWDAARSRLNRWETGIEPDLSEAWTDGDHKDTQWRPQTDLCVQAASPHKTQGFCNKTGLKSCSGYDIVIDENFTTVNLHKTLCPGRQNAYHDEKYQLEHRKNIGTHCEFDCSPCRENAENSSDGVKSSDGKDLHQKTELGHSQKSGTLGTDVHRVSGTQGTDVQVEEGILQVVRLYENAKRLHGRLDFHDLAMKFAGVSADETELTFRKCYREGTTPQEIVLWIIDEYQDCSRLLDLCVERLSEAAGELILLGDRYQSVYGFAGSDWRCMAFREEQAKATGNRILLNRSWRNRQKVLDWGEEILRQDRQYEERRPMAVDGDSSVGMIESKRLLENLSSLGGTDTMVLCRTWFGLAKVKAQLDELGIPWRSCQEKFRSRWEAPVKIAFVLVMRDLAAGMRISEQDWRRVTEELPAKQDGKEFFVRGTKAKWKKIECSREPLKTLGEVGDWGATEWLIEWIRKGEWRRDAYLLMDTAIDKFGVEEVRNPRLRLGSCHSVKGMQADNVFCLATSTNKANDCDFWEDLFLKYVTVTRARFHYRVVVDLLDHARGRALFLPCPPGYWKFDQEMPDVRGVQRTEGRDRLGDEASGGVAGEVYRDSVQQEGNSGSDTLCERKVRRDRDETTQGRGEIAAAETRTSEDLEEWWNL
jgi:superfamily I DNA/RNA helicase